jgi:hypothetical protein
MMFKSHNNHADKIQQHHYNMQYFPSDMYH